MVRAHEDRGEERDVRAAAMQNGTVQERERFRVLSWLNGFTFSFVEIFGIDRKRSWKEQQRQKEEVDNLHVNRPVSTYGPLIKRTIFSKTPVTSVQHRPAGELKPLKRVRVLPWAGASWCSTAEPRL
jgi:hypothetical protein